MPAPFDKQKASLFRTVSNYMGYEAAWLSSVDGLVKRKGVTFKYPTIKEKQFLEWDEFVYRPPNRIMEYMDADFPGLYESVRNTNGESNERVTIFEQDPINGEQYGVGYVHKMFDGSIVYAIVFPYKDENEEP